MGRRKTIRPHRSVGTIEKHGKLKLENENTSEKKDEEIVNVEKPFFVEIDGSSWVSNEHIDISEIILSNLKVSEQFYGRILNEEFHKHSRYSLRFKLDDMNEYLNRIKIGHWPVLDNTSICLELMEKCVFEGVEREVLVVSGNFDGPDEGISGLVHLASLKFLTLRPIMGFTLLKDILSIRVRVEIQKCAFEACESLLDNTRPLWKKSMQNVMSWLRPEVLTSETRYGYKVAPEMDIKSPSLKKRARFDVAGFYEAIKPSKEEPMLEDQLFDLLPELRPYQKRAAYWMVQREKGVAFNGNNKSKFFTPFSVPINLLDSSSKMYYNPFSGNISLQAEQSFSDVPGGILADEMGLGKTVELLACIMAHEMPLSEVVKIGTEVSRHKENNTRRVKKERIDCICGSISQYSYTGVWVQCDVCDVWQHADCVGYSANRKVSEEEEENSKNRAKRINNVKIVVRDGLYICKLCSELIQATESPVSTGATLIVCPTPILAQWHSEIIRHTKPGSLVTCIYEGVKKASLSNEPAMDVDELIKADIVLTTYDVLREDLSHDCDRHQGDRRTMRFEKRYPVIPTPLTKVFWWRLCLDEAQMVESHNGIATEMALRLHAKHRWCVTGTPIQQKLDDLYGLLKFLKAGPFDNLRSWTDIIRIPYENGDEGAVSFTHKLFKDLMWRSSKVHVAEELHIPPQEECVSWLSLAPIEEHFYNRQHETCVDCAREVINRFKTDILKSESTDLNSRDALGDAIITNTEAAKLFNSLLKLRQACCHPQVGSSGLRTIQKSPMTMEEILLVLIGKTKIEGEEALRKVVVALNALAGISIIKEDYSQAVSCYTESLTLAEEHSEDLRVDTLLKIHVRYNLAEIILIAPDNLPEFQTLSRFFESDQFHVICSKPHRSVKFMIQECLRKACEDLKLKYLSAFTLKLSVVQQEFRKSYNQVCKSFRDRKSQHTSWWMESLQKIEQKSDLSNEFMRKIEEAFSDTNSKTSSRLASRFRSITAMKLYIQSGLDSLEESRKSLLDRLLEIDETMGSPREEDIERVRFCTNCRAIDDGPLCVHCELNELFQVYEARLFRLNKEKNGEVITSAEEAIDLQKRRSDLNRFFQTLSKTEKNSNLFTEENGNKRDLGEKVMVSKAPSELEVVLGIIKSKSKGLLEKESMFAAKNQLLQLEGMRKEYPLARTLALSQAQVLLAHDEINMATSRLHLKEDESDTVISALNPEELDISSAENSSEKFVASATLSRIKGQLRYLKGLAQSTQNLDSVEEDSLTITNLMEKESCPVCQEKMGNRKMVFQCGHVTCCKCLLAMMDHHTHTKCNTNWIMCPTCRQHTLYENVALADESINSRDPNHVRAHVNSEASIYVRGSYSTKIEAVTRRILWIGSKDPEAKILVFTSWNDVLDVLQHALAANNISYVRMKGGRKSDGAIKQFRGQSSDESKKIQVLLLLVQHGANGLNLLEAEHVILVEPLLNPAAEAQAIGRVHRIGQQNKTLVHRFIVKDTVEESIYKMNRSRSAGSFVSGNRKNQDQPVLTLRDVESLFRVEPSVATNQNSSGSLMHLPPSVAAALAAERRLMERST